MTSKIDGATAFPAVEYAIFDMDGLLSAVSSHPKSSLVQPGANTDYSSCRDSERIYTDVTNIILGRYGHTLTWEIKSGVMGKVQRQAGEYILSHYPDVLEHMSVDEYLAERNVMQEELFKKVPLMPGAAHLVKGLHAAGVPIALATGSTYENFLFKTGHLQDIFSLFPADSIVTANSPSVKPGRGKPFPDIFLAAAQTLGRDVGTADECTDAQREERRKGVVFEDAIPGVKSGVAAGMNVIWIPDENLRALAPDEDYGSAQVLSSLEQWDPVQWGLAALPSTSLETPES